MISPRPHDMLRLSGAGVLPLDAPPWAHTALSGSPWAVVRRVTAVGGRIAVGVRGTSRSERYALTVDLVDVCEVVGPEDLADKLPRAGRDLAAMCALHIVSPVLNEVGLQWGPTGSIGFELATGIPTATTESDLDLLVRVARGSPEVLAVLGTLHRRFCSLTVRVDCQIETVCGAVALAELVGNGSEIMVRTAAGPRLVPRAAAVP